MGSNDEDVSTSELQLWEVVGQGALQAYSEVCKSMLYRPCILLSIPCGPF